MRFLMLLPISSLLIFATARDIRLLGSRDCSLGIIGLQNKLTIINATPYPFYRSRVESCQVGKWDIHTTPPVIDPGAAATFEYTITKGADAAADISYVLKIDDVLTEKHFNIHIQGRKALQGYVISAEVLGGLTTAGHGPDGDRFQFGDIKDVIPQPGYSDVFVLSGNETYGYGTVEPPVAWMSNMGPILKQLSLKDLVIPASHDSGMSQTHDGIGVDFNTRTQDVSIYEQLLRGIRMVDVRPHLGPDGDDFRLGHFTDALGAFGQSLAEAMGDVNRFQSENPGELIIIDLNPGFTRLKGPTVTPFTEQQFNDLLDTLINGLPGLKTEYELTVDPSGMTGVIREPIDTFYKQNVSPIFLRILADRNKWLGRLPELSNNKTTGVVTTDSLPIVSHWSDTGHPDELSKDQKDTLDLSYDPNKLFMSAFILTLKGAHVIDPFGSSIRSLSFQAKQVLYENAWSWSSSWRYPNMLQFDYVLDKQVAALAVSMNYQYAFPKLWR